MRGPLNDRAQRIFPLRLSMIFYSRRAQRQIVLSLAGETPAENNEGSRRMIPTGDVYLA
jgi:hypothetical protein